MFILLGRLRYDISLGRINALIDRLIHSTRKLKEIHNILSINPIFKDRQHEIGFIERDFSSYFGSSGVLSRSATIYPDARFIGYEFHQCIDYFRYSSSSSDSLDRYPLRANELMESCRIIYPIVYPLFDLHSLSLSFPLYFDITLFSLTQQQQ